MLIHRFRRKISCSAGMRATLWSALVLLSSTCLWAHHGPAVSVPHVPSAPPMNAQCTNFPGDFGGAVHVNINSYVSALLVRTDSDLYVCVTGVDRRPWQTGPQPGPNSTDAVYLYLDTTHGAPAAPTGNILQFRVSPASGAGVRLAGLRGDGAAFSGAVPDGAGWTAVGAHCTNCEEFVVQWRTEFRISRTLLGPAWGHVAGYLLSYADGTPLHPKTNPDTATPSNPSGWGDLELGSATADLAITDITPRTGMIPVAAQGFPGTTVHIRGYNLCDGSPRVVFGTAPPVSPVSCVVDGSGAANMTVNVGRFAVSGPVTVTQTTGSRHSTTDRAGFTVQEFRNVDGFQFGNYSGPREINIGDYAELFGPEQFLVHFDPCIPFGGHCPIYTPFPDPIAFGFYGVTSAILSRNGECYGMVQSSNRLLRGEVPISRFAPSARNVWNVDTVSPPVRPGLEHFLDLQHISQFSGEFLGAYLRTSVRNRSSASAARDVFNDLHRALASSPPALQMVALAKGTEGHVVLAYDVEPGSPSVNGGVGDGDYFIYVYDPNQPWGTDELTNPVTHSTRMFSSGAIHVLSNGRWSFTGNFADSPWAGDMSVLVPVSADTVPLSHPTMPNVTDLVGTILLASGPVETVQIRDSSGRTLLRSDGSLNNDPGTGLLNAARMGSLAARGPSNPAYLFSRPDRLEHTVVGSGSGVYSEVAMSKGVLVGVRDVPALVKTADRIELDSHSGAVGFSTDAASKNFTAQLIARAADSSTHSVLVNVGTSAKAMEKIAFVPGYGALTYEHSGSPASSRVFLSYSAEGGSPGAAIVPEVQMASGDRVVIRPENWANLTSAPVDLEITHANGKTDKSSIKVVPLVRLQGMKGGIAYLEVEASALSAFHAEVIEASCSGAAGEWTTLGKIGPQGASPSPVSFNTQPCFAKGSRPAFLVRVTDSHGSPIVMTGIPMQK